MKRLVSFLFWTFLFLAVCLGLDQLLVRVEMPLPVLSEVRSFYVDFRTRLLQLGHRLPAKGAPAGKKAAVPPAAKGAAGARPKAMDVQPKGAEPPPRSLPEKTPAPAGAGAPRYVYVDGQGELHFADSLEEVPASFRKGAQPLEK